MLSCSCGKNAPTQIASQCCQPWAFNSDGRLPYRAPQLRGSRHEAPCLWRGASPFRHRPEHVRQLSEVRAILRSQSGNAGLVGAALDVVVAGSASRPCIVESVEGTCLCEAGFDPNKAPKNLFANEPALSVHGMAGSCGSSDPDPGGSAIASDTILPGKRARKALFIPPSSPL